MAEEKHIPTDHRDIEQVSSTNSKHEEGEVRRASGTLEELQKTTTIDTVHNDQ